ncbi:nucleoside hydrolase [Nocardioides albus]|uniref:Inosine-uridine nucleoside N-ribohydrolase n=1 Tax=Nocardioides albus TaxID=1841 RepID=A0A7W5FA09_9ACTN|nr:nucleoside hydrolase [Nocardioides albus]MBB3090627.1 inosine-uridine nucleoside N-ribohydrolase [Nocardioides albus]GGU25282.1 inosine-uridine preferring nucleoside hydrolase [Nocardioides albus]
MLLIDTDPGLDDAHALAMAFGRMPADELIVTTVAGNVGIDAVTRNAQHLVRAIAPGIPVARGAAAPLLGTPVEAPHIHGADGIAGFAWPDTDLGPLHPSHAAEVIIEAAQVHGKDLAVVALGPLTNLALAIRLEPGIIDQIGRVVSMGGSPSGRGNASVTAEFNVFADPVAAEIVYSTVRNHTVITWDLSLDNRFTRSELDGFWAGTTAAASTLRAIDAHRQSTEPQYDTASTFGRVDPLAMAVALDPSVVTAEDEHAVLVDTTDGLARGYTAVDWSDSVGERPKILIPRAIDRDRACALLTL